MLPRPAPAPWEPRSAARPAEKPHTAHTLLLPGPRVAADRTGTSRTARSSGRQRSSTAGWASPAAGRCLWPETGPHSWKTPRQTRQRPAPADPSSGSTAPPARRAAAALPAATPARRNCPSPTARCPHTVLRTQACPLWCGVCRCWRSGQGRPPAPAAVSGTGRGTDVWSQCPSCTPSSSRKTDSSEASPRTSAMEPARTSRPCRRMAT